MPLRSHSSCNSPARNLLYSDIMATSVKVNNTLIRHTHNVQKLCRRHTINQLITSNVQSIRYTLTPTTQHLPGLCCCPSFFDVPSIPVGNDVSTSSRRRQVADYRQSHLASRHLMTRRRVVYRWLPHTRARLQWSRQLPPYSELLPLLSSKSLVSPLVASSRNGNSQTEAGSFMHVCV